MVSASTLDIEHIDWNPLVQSIANDFNEIKAHIIENAPSSDRMDEVMSEYMLFLQRMEPKMSVWRGVLFLVLMGVGAVSCLIAMGSACLYYPSSLAVRACMWAMRVLRRGLELPL